MTIRDLNRYMESLWDWGFLDGCFGVTRSRVGDVDGILEHYGEILLLEGKPMWCAPEIGEKWRTEQTRMNGQSRLWAGLAGRGVTVMVLWGEAENAAEPMKKTPKRMQLWRRFQPEPDIVKDCSVELVRHYVSRWWQWAEKTNESAA